MYINSLLYAGIMSKKRKISISSSPMIKVEVKEENIYGDDVLIARGRLKGALQELIEHSDDDSGSSEDESRKHRYRSPRKKEIDSSRYYTKVKRRRSDTSPAAATAFHHTYVMKLFDRSVDLARFEEETPLYPICRAWMANQPRNPQTIIKRRTSSPDPEYEKVGMSASWNGDRVREIYQMPSAKGSPVTRVPSPLPEQLAEAKQNVNINYDEKAPVPRDELIKNHLQRWTKVKQKWFAQANKNEERFEQSFNILTTIYNKAQENME